MTEKPLIMGGFSYAVQHLLGLFSQRYTSLWLRRSHRVHLTQEGELLFRTPGTILEWDTRALKRNGRGAAVEAALD